MYGTRFNSYFLWNFHKWKANLEISIPELDFDSRFVDVACARCWYLAPEFRDVTGKVVKWGIPEKGSQNAVQKCLFQVASALQSKVMAKT